MFERISFEFFPPRTTQGLEKLCHTATLLKSVAPEYFSVTFGARGSTQAFTKETVYALQKLNAGIITPHISCLGTKKDFIQDLLNEYLEHHISHLVALRGDLPANMTSGGDFRYANELVEWIKTTFNDAFYISVACYPENHPQSLNYNQDFEHFKNKVNAGADEAITQYFYNTDAYFYFVEKCQKANIHIPIIAGIMPITNYLRLARFSDLCGAELPRWIRKQLEAYENDELSLKAFGVDVVTKLCETLFKGGAPGLHIYTLNEATASLAFLANLKQVL